MGGTTRAAASILAPQRNGAALYAATRRSPPLPGASHCREKPSRARAAAGLPTAAIDAAAVERPVRPPAAPCADRWPGVLTAPHPRPCPYLSARDGPIPGSELGPSPHVSLGVGRRATAPRAGRNAQAPRCRRHHPSGNKTGRSAFESVTPKMPRRAGCPPWAPTLVGAEGLERRTSGYRKGPFWKSRRRIVVA